MSIIGRLGLGTQIAFLLVIREEDDVSGATWLPPSGQGGGDTRLSSGFICGDTCLPLVGLGTAGGEVPSLFGGCLEAGLHPLEEGVHAGSALYLPSGPLCQRPDASTTLY